MERQIETILKALGDKIERLEGEISYKDYRIQTLEKELKEAKEGKDE